MRDHGPTIAAGVFGPARLKLDRCGKSLAFSVNVRTGVSPGSDRFSLPGCLPVPWQECLEFMTFGAPGYHAFKYVGEPGQRFDAVQFRGLDERRNGRPVTSAAVTSSKKGILARDRYGSDGAFNGVGIQLQSAIFEKQ